MNIKGNITLEIDKMETRFENSYRVSKEYPCVVDYTELDSFVSMSKMHYHPYYEIYFLASGQVKYYFYNKIFTLKPGNVIIIKPNEVHRTVAVDNYHGLVCKRYTLNVDESLVSKIKKYNKDAGLCLNNDVLFFKDGFAEIIEIIKKIKDEIAEYDITYMGSVRNYVERVLIELSNPRKCEIDKSAVCLNDLQIQEAIDYIICNYNKKIQLKECADICFMSESNFTKKFHKTMGMNFKSYVNCIRIENACEMLKNSELSISKIAEMVGYEDNCYFSIVFKKIVGISPKEFRDSNSKDEINSQ